ncbi:MAG TPA: PPK2 family polyphosphate kinase [Candidatus Elarobacter sp.]
MSTAVAARLRFGGDLKAIDPRSTPGVKSRKKAEAMFAADAAELAELQERLRAEGERAIVLLLQGMDTCGKDGTVKHVVGQINPAGVHLVSFKAPTEAELRHHFLWRIRRALPVAGDLGIFNRSHYEDVLVPRVHATLPKETLEKRYDRINEFEKNLVQAGTHIVKFFLHISEAEQLKRLEARLEDPQRRWKLNPEDFAEHRRWDDYRRAYDRMLKRTSTHRAPWFVIPANHKWFRNLAVARIVLETLDDLGMDFPKPAVDVDELRRSYYIAAQDARRR